MVWIAGLMPPPKQREEWRPPLNGATVTSKMDGCECRVESPGHRWVRPCAAHGEMFFHDRVYVGKHARFHTVSMDVIGDIVVDEYVDRFEAGYKVISTEGVTWYTWLVGEAIAFADRGEQSAFFYRPDQVKLAYPSEK